TTYYSLVYCMCEVIRPPNTVVVKSTLVADFLTSSVTFLSLFLSQSSLYALRTLPAISCGMGADSRILRISSDASSYCFGSREPLELPNVLCITSPIFVSSRNRRNASAVTANPGGTLTPLAVSSPRLAHFPPTSGMSSFLTSSSRTTMASGLGTRLGSCGHLWRDWFFDHNSGFHG